MTLSLRLRVPLAGFDLDVAIETQARSVGVFGASGAGKTSLLEAIAGWRAARGTIAVGERVLLDTSKGICLPIEERGVGYVPQDALLFPHRSVRGNVEAGLRRGASRGGRELLRRAVEVLELGPLLERRADAVSGGERQRVALARALGSAPDLLLLDEPLGGLDQPLRRRILPDLIRVREEFDLRTLFVSHDPTEVQALCDEVAVLERGRIEVFGSAREALRERVRPHAGFENVLHGTVSSADGATATVEVAPGVPIVAPSAGLRAGERAVLALGADEILVATAAPHGISARNVLLARVEAIEDRGEGVMLDASLGGSARVWVALTDASTRELGLARGSTVHLVFKTQSVRVLSGPPAQSGAIAWRP